MMIIDHWIDMWVHK